MSCASSPHCRPLVAGAVDLEVLRRPRTVGLWWQVRWGSPMPVFGVQWRLVTFWLDAQLRLLCVWRPSCTAGLWWQAGGRCYLQFPKLLEVAGL